MTAPLASARAWGAGRSATWTIGALIAGVAAVVLGVLVTAGPSSGSKAAAPTISASEQLADVFADVVPADETVGAIGGDAVDALNGVRPIVEVVDPATALLPRYVVGSAEPGDGDAWEVQQAVQQRGALELVIPTAAGQGAVLRVFRTAEDPVAPATTGPEAPPTTVPSTTATTAPAGGPVVTPPVLPPPTSTPPDGPSSGTHQVVAGESFWSVAQTTLADHLGRAPSPAEVTSYWSHLVQLNQERLPDPGNPDLVLPGFVLTLPAA